MSDKFSFDDLLKKVASDRKFRITLVHDPAKALSDIGVDATPGMIAAVKGVDPKSIEAVAEAFGADSEGVHADTLALC
jgi:hypothetical protein